MDVKSIELDSGKIGVSTYSYKKDMYTPVRIRNVVHDIYLHSDCRDDISCIFKVIPNEGKTPADVLDEYTEKYGKDSFITLKAGELVDHPGIFDDNMNEEIESMIGYALEAYFYKILFTMKMERCYGLRDVCIYSNDKTEKWIKDNSGDNGIIRSIISSNKVN